MQFTNMYMQRVCRCTHGRFSSPIWTLTTSSGRTHERFTSLMWTYSQFYRPNSGALYQRKSSTHQTIVAAQNQRTSKLLWRHQTNTQIEILQRSSLRTNVRQQTSAHSTSHDRKLCTDSRKLCSSLNTNAQRKTLQHSRKLCSSPRTSAQQKTLRQPENQRTAENFAAVRELTHIRKLCSSSPELAHNRNVVAAHNQRTAKTFAVVHNQLTAKKLCSSPELMLSRKLCSIPKTTAQQKNFVAARELASREQYTTENFTSARETTTETLRIPPRTGFLTESRISVLTVKDLQHHRTNNQLKLCILPLLHSLCSIFYQQHIMPTHNYEALT